MLKRTQKTYKIFLYSGLFVLGISFLFKWHGNPVLFGIFLGMAIALKAIFLIAVLLKREVKLGLWFYLILTGVAMILLSLCFKACVPVLYRTLFYAAVFLKLSGLLLLTCKKKNDKNE